MNSTVAGWLAAATLLACQPSSGAPLSQDDVAAIHTATDRFVQTALAADWDAWAALSADSAVFMQPNGAAIEGRQAIRQWGAGFEGMTSYTSTVLEVDGRGDLAFSRGRYVLVLAPEAASHRADSGEYVTVWRKSSEGVWRISRNIWNSTEVVAEETGTSK